MINRYTTRNRNYEKATFKKRTIAPISSEDEDNTRIPIRLPPRDSSHLVKIVRPSHEESSERNRYKLPRFN